MGPIEVFEDDDAFKSGEFLFDKFWKGEVCHGQGLVRVWTSSVLINVKNKSSVPKYSQT